MKQLSEKEVHDLSVWVEVTREAVQLMRLSLALAIVAVVSELIGIYKVFTHSNRWWMFLVIAFAAMRVSKLMRSEAIKIINDGLK